MSAHASSSSSTSAVLPSRKGRSKTRTSDTSSSSSKNVLMKDRQYLYCSIDRFLRDHTNFEAHEPIDVAMLEIGECKKVNEIFTIVTRNRLLSMTDALNFILFLHTATATPIDDADPPITGSSKFLAGAALDEVVAVYDIGIKETVWDYCKNNESSDDDDDDESDEEPSEDVEADDIDKEIH